MFCVLVFLFFVKFSSAQYEGDGCTTPRGVAGVCVQIRNCKAALNDLRKGIPPQTCSFLGKEPIVCCGEVTTTTPLETSTSMKWTTPSEIPETTSTTTEPTTTTTETTIVLTSITTEKTVSKFLPNECPPIAPNKTEIKSGRKARDKCIEYQDKLVYPCKEDRSGRWNNCWNDLQTFIIGGQESFDSEFPHMALLGFDTPPDPISFLCGGTLISDKFVMTAGHCASSRVLGPVTYALIGVIDKTKYNPDQLHKIKRVILHPSYKAPIKYHDLGLLELENRIELTPYIVPACLDVAGSDHPTAVATGWGLTDFRGESSNILLKVALDRFDDAECMQSYQINRNMRNGFTPDTQLCFGSREASKDTCQGDSGGPLQIKDPNIQCMYTVLGVTSFGRGCGLKNHPALYTRVAHYVDWIESIVWPDPA